MPVLEYCLALPANFLYSPGQTEIVILPVQISACWRGISSLVQVLASTEAGGWASFQVLWENCRSEGRNVPEWPFFPPTNQALTSSLPLSPFSSPSNNISCPLSGHEVEIRDELCPHNQKNIVSLTFTWTKLAVFFRVWVMVFRPTAKTGLSFRRCLKSFHQYLHGWQAVWWHQHDFVSDLHSADTAQIWLKHDACPNFYENLMTHGFWNSSFLCCFKNSQTMIGMNHFPNFLDVFFLNKLFPSFLNSYLIIFYSTFPTKKITKKNKESWIKFKKLCQNK